MKNKRVAWCTNEPSVAGTFTPYKVYEVFNEDGGSFNVKDDRGGIRFCLEIGCGHLSGASWMLADIVDEEKGIESVVAEEPKPKKTKKWSKWYKNKTGEKPVGFDDEQRVKCKWNDGDLTRGTVGSAAWFFSGNDITHYKVLLADTFLDKQPKKNTDWQDNVLGVSPVPRGTFVEVELKCGKILEGACFNWGKTPMPEREIVKWRLA